jgi:iron(III) transport system substrate-binding protein
LDAFEKANPDITVEHHSMRAADVRGKYLLEDAAGGQSADIRINSAMDLQRKLANDGHARMFRPTTANMGSWNNRAFAVAVEPIVIG